MKNAIKTVLIVLILSLSLFAGKPDRANWVTVNDTNLSFLIYSEKGKVISVISTEKNKIITYVQAESGLYRWIETLNGLSVRASSTECQKLLKPGEVY